MFVICFGIQNFKMTELLNCEISDYAKICRLCLKKGNNYNKLVVISMETIDIIRNITEVNVSTYVQHKIVYLFS